MSLEVRLKPVEELLFRSDLVAVGKFRCPVDHPLYFDSGAVPNHTIVFPRTSTAIHYERGGSFVGGPNVVSIYNEGQRFTRRAVDAADQSDWYAVADEVVTDAVAAFDAAVLDRPERRFRHTHAPAPGHVYLAQRVLFERLERRHLIDGTEVEEQVMRFLTAVLRSAYGAARKTSPSREAVEEAKRCIAARPEENLPLRSLAARAQLSPYQLCREFRAVTGMTITRYRHSLRLRIALDRLRGRVDLTELAFDLGYSSHSHFTYVFRHHFGVTPSCYRART